MSKNISKIKFKNLLGKLYELELKENSTFLDVKNEVCKLMGYKIESVILVFQGKLLYDDERLKDLNINTKQYIHVTGKKEFTYVIGTDAYVATFREYNRSVLSKYQQQLKEKYEIATNVIQLKNIQNQLDAIMLLNTTASYRLIQSNVRISVEEEERIGLQDVRSAIEFFIPKPKSPVKKISLTRDKEREGSITIGVAFLTGQRYTLQLDRSISIRELKRKIFEKNRQLSVSEMILVYGGRKLSELDRTLWWYGVKHEATVHVLILRGYSFD